MVTFLARLGLRAPVSLQYYCAVIQGCILLSRFKRNNHTLLSPFVISATTHAAVTRCLFSNCCWAQTNRQIRYTDSRDTLLVVALVSATATYLPTGTNWTCLGQYSVRSPPLTPHFTHYPYIYRQRPWKLPVQSYPAWLLLLFVLSSALHLYPISPTATTSNGPSFLLSFCLFLHFTLASTYDLPPPLLPIPFLIQSRRTRPPSIKPSLPSLDRSIYSDMNHG